MGAIPISSYIMEKTCDECGKIFQPSSRHKKCPTCRFNPENYVNKCTGNCGKSIRKKNGKCIICLERSEGYNANWKGGRRKNSSGYIMILIKEHPRAGKNSGYVFEHILVMESIIGRILLPGENVHHKNGVRDDNSKENLELWCKPQPSGIRASDAVDWAKEILKRYSGLEK